MYILYIFDLFGVIFILLLCFFITHLVFISAVYIKVLHHFLITYDSLPRATWKFVRFILTSGLTRWMREYFLILFWRAENPAFQAHYQTASPQKCIEKHSDGRTK